MALIHIVGGVLMKTDNLYAINLGEHFLVINLESLKTELISKKEFQNKEKLIEKYSDLFAQKSFLDTSRPKELGKTISPMIIPSFNCNYSCSYCFEKKLGTLQDKMTREDVDKIIEFYKIYCDRESFPLNFSEIRIMGGEPLLPENRNVLEEIISVWANDSFIITTNGTYINDFLDLFSGHNVKFKVSLDGIQKVHFKRRYCSQKDSYQKTLNGISNLLLNGMKVTVLTVFCPEYVEFYSSFFDLLEELGWLKSENLNVAFVPQVGIGCDDISHDYIVNALKAFKILKERDRRTCSVDARKLLPGGINLINAIIDEKHGVFSPYRCSCLSSPDFAFLPDGSIKLCIGISDELGYIGTYKPSIKIDWERLKLYKHRRIDGVAMQKCQKCAKKIFCLGGCVATSLSKGKGILGQYCDLWNNMDYLDYFETIFC